MLKGSRGCGPAITLSMSAASSTVLLNGPLWLKGVCERNASGRVAAATRPYVALKPYTPQKEAGMRIDPPASEPCATAARPPATAAALPPEEPPAFLLVAKGVLVGPKSRLSVVALWPNSGVLVLPSTIAPAFYKRRSEEHTSELQSHSDLVCRLLLEKK